MNDQEKSYRISAEDKVRLQALAERLHMSESDALQYLYDREFGSFEESAVTGESDDEDVS